MRPSLQDADVLTLVPPLCPRTGEVVCVLRGGDLRVHRVAVEGARVLLRGDALLLDDGWFDWAEVKGFVRDVRRRGQRVPSFLWRGALPPILGRVTRMLRQAVSLLRIRRTSDLLRP